MTKEQDTHTIYGKALWDQINKSTNDFTRLPKLGWVEDVDSEDGWSSVETPDGERFQRWECEVKEGYFLAPVKERVVDSDAYEKEEKALEKFMEAHPKIDFGETYVPSAAFTTEKRLDNPKRYALEGCKFFLTGFRVQNTEVQR